MSQPLLVTGRCSRTPYYFPKLCINIYSAEELCYLFKTNPFILDRDIMDKHLAEWLKEECGLEVLGAKLLELFRTANSLSLFVLTILEHTNYCTADEQRQIADILQSSIGLKDYEKRKKQADFLVKNEKYLLALQEYDSILAAVPEGEMLIRGKVCHNRGVVYAHLFMFDRAADNFLQAYELNGREESGLQYLAAIRRQYSEQDYVRFISEHPQYYNLSLKAEYLLEQVMRQYEDSNEYRRLKALKLQKEEGNVNAYYDGIERLTGEMKQRYRENVN